MAEKNTIKDLLTDELKISEIRATIYPNNSAPIRIRLGLQPLLLYCYKCRLTAASE